MKKRRINIIIVKSYSQVKTWGKNYKKQKKEKRFRTFQFSNPLSSFFVSCRVSFRGVGTDNGGQQPFQWNFQIHQFEEAFCYRSGSGQ
jgi:hypothetical protein